MLVNFSMLREFRKYEIANERKQKRARFGFLCFSEDRVVGNVAKEFRKLKWNIKSIIESSDPWGWKKFKKLRKKYWNSLFIFGMLPRSLLSETRRKARVEIFYLVLLTWKENSRVIFRLLKQVFDCDDKKRFQRRMHFKFILTRRCCLWRLECTIDRNGSRQAGMLSCQRSGTEAKGKACCSSRTAKTVHQVTQFVAKRYFLKAESLNQSS